MRSNKKTPLKSEKTQTTRAHKAGVVGYSRKTALLEEAITQMNAGKYGRSSAALKELLALDPLNMEARRLFATLHLRLGSLIPARQAFDSLISEAFQRQDYWLAESLLREYLAAGPRCVPFLEKLGSIHQEKGDALEAVAEYGKAVDILVEDPDPENPHHAAQLYAKIRELAPVSPVAFRLASLFDAQTGEMLARQPGPSGESTPVPRPEMAESSQEAPASPQPVNGTMPWDVQELPEVVEPVPEASSSTEAPVASVRSASNDASVQEVRSLESPLVPPDRSVLEPVESGTSEVLVDTPAEVPLQDSGATPLAAEDSHHVGPVVPGNSQFSALPPDSGAETSVTSLESEPIVAIGDSVAAQEQSSELAALSPENTTPVSDQPLAVAPANRTNVAGDQGDVSTEGLGASVEFLRQHEEVTASTALEVNQEATESIPPSHPESALLPDVEPDPQELDNAKSSSSSEPFGPVPTGAREDSWSWDHSGLSRESDLTSSPKFKGQPSAIIAQPEPIQTDVGEVSGQASATSLPSDPLLESPSPEISNSDEGTLQKDEGFSGSRSHIAPMPWDQVQESAISIPLASADSFLTEYTEPKAEIAELRLMPDVANVQDPPLASLGSLATEGESFSIVQASQSTQAPPIPESERTAAGSNESSYSTDGESIHVEPESLVITTSSQTIDEPSTLDVPVTIEAPPVPTDESKSVGAVTSGEFQDQSTALPLSVDDAPVMAVHERLDEEVTGTPATLLPQSTDENAGTKTGEVQSLPVLSVQPEVREPSLSMVIPPPPATETLQGLTLDSQPQGLALVEEQTQKPEFVVAPPTWTGDAERQTPESRTPDVALEEPQVQISEPMPQQKAWAKTGESIRFIEQPPVAPVARMSPENSRREEVDRSQSAAATAVGVLFESSTHIAKPEANERPAGPKLNKDRDPALNRIGIAIAGFISSCFSTTRAIVTTIIGLMVLSGTFVALGIGVIALTWVMMEEPPSPAFHALTTTPQQTLSASKKNGYLLLLGIDASVEQDPIQAGSGRKADAGDRNKALACFGNPGSDMGERSNASGSTLRGWVRSSDPIGQFKSHQGTIREWGSQHQVALERYGQWKQLPFEDWGYGQSVGPPCGAMVFTHQLHVADGFVQSHEIGVDRLETDMEAWRIVLGQARTLPIKMLALQAINDDIAVASGLLVQENFDGKDLGRLTKILRPLDQAELSIRWPMQSELVFASKTYETQLKAARDEEQSISTVVAAALHLPKQRRLNDYAKYYDASHKAAGERQYGSLPKWKDYLHFPASGMMDYLTNPIENIVGLEPLPAWDLYNGLMVDTEARLRLASLQAWLRRGSAESELLTRIAKAGQGFYDPYTGLPMLVNMKKGVFYSVGHDGKDQDADPQTDVVAEIPLAQVPASPAKLPSTSSKSR